MVRTTIFLRYIFLSSSSWTLYCPRPTTSPFESRFSGQVHSAKFERRGNRDIVARNEPYIRKLRHSVPRYSRIDSASVLAPGKILLCT